MSGTEGLPEVPDRQQLSPQPCGVWTFTPHFLSNFMIHHIFIFIFLYFILNKEKNKLLFFNSTV